MKLHYYPETDSAHCELNVDSGGGNPMHVAFGFNVDLDSAAKLSALTSTTRRSAST